MAQQKPESMFDKRIVARNLSRNKISRKEYEQYLKGLKDAKDKYVPLFSPAAVGTSSDESNT